MDDGKVSRVVVVTGGTSGIGHGLCRAFVDAGDRVVFTGLEEQNAIDAIAAEFGGGAEGFQVDAGNPADMDRLLREVKQRHGRLDVFVANAGIGEHAKIGGITEEQFDAMIGVNLKGVLFATQSALPLMERGGAVVWLGSTGSNAPVPGMSVYCGTKAALRAMAQAIVYEIKGSGIRLNVLSPGPTDTESLRGAFTKAIGEDGMKKAVASIEGRSPSGRIGSTAEIAAAALFLASEAASYVNGQELFVDGGLRNAG